MESPAQRCARVLTALEDLVAQEAAALAQRDFNAVLALQDRTAPLVEFLSRAAASDVAELGPRFRALQEQRRQTSDRLAADIDSARAELQQTQVAQRRVAKIAPAYGQPAPVRRQLQAVG